MFGFRKRKGKGSDPEAPEEYQPEGAPEEASEAEAADEAAPEPKEEPTEEPAAPGPSPADEDEGAEKKGGLFGRLRERLAKTRSSLAEGLGALVLGRKEIDDELLEDLETQLLTADVGVTATQRIIDDLTRRVSRKELTDPQALVGTLREELTALLAPAARPLTLPEDQEGPFVLLMVGVNGTGKTTTIGKLAQRYRAEGREVVLGAADTFRAAAAEQLQEWGERTGVPVIRGPEGGDPGAVAHDAVEAGRARGADVVIIDTAGRLHTQDNLMEELAKVRRVIAKQLPDAPHETMLVIDGGTGQNALSQARQFNQSVPLTGLTVTKLDGTARGGVLFALAAELEGVAIRFIGVGESAEDLRPFDAAEFVDALFEE
ncbi:signal recognition particle-docking protein FtsY [Thiohalospira halophila]|nr:signal recognition particle-docking protein FtsY [Thiohalospira halophila]